MKLIVFKKDPRFDRFNKEANCILVKMFTTKGNKQSLIKHYVKIIEQ